MCNYVIVRVYQLCTLRVEGLQPHRPDAARGNNWNCFSVHSAAIGQQTQHGAHCSAHVHVPANDCRRHEPQNADNAKGTDMLLVLILIYSCTVYSR